MISHAVKLQCQKTDSFAFGRDMGESAALTCMADGVYGSRKDTFVAALAGDSCRRSPPGCERGGDMVEQAGGNNWATDRHLVVSGAV